MLKADLILIGGGAAGLTLAAELAGQARVILLEAEPHLGTQASGRSAAVFIPSYGHGQLRALTTLSRPALEQPDPEWFPGGSLLSSRGILRLVLPGGRAQHDAVIAGQRGIETITPQAAAELFPLIRPDRLETASYEPDAHDIDTEALLQGSARKARAGGVTLWTGAQVTGIGRRGTTWQVSTRSERFEAPIVINAAGAWANAVAGLAGVAPLPLSPCRRSVAVLPLPSELAGRGRTPFTVTAPLRWYAKTEAGQLLVSPGDEDPSTPHDAYADDMVIAEGLHRFSEDTGLNITRLDHSWAGLRTVTPDEYPVVGFDASCPGFFWLAGQAGFGIQCAPGLAQIAATLVLGGDHTLARGFSPARFSGA